MHDNLLAFIGRCSLIRFEGKKKEKRKKTLNFDAFLPSVCVLAGENGVDLT